jgi:hypothetical protein
VVLLVDLLQAVVLEHLGKVTLAELQQQVPVFMQVQVVAVLVVLAALGGLLIMALAVMEVHLRFLEPQLFILLAAAAEVQLIQPHQQMDTPAVLAT